MDSQRFVNNNMKEAQRMARERAILLEKTSKSMADSRSASTEGPR